MKVNDSLSQLKKSNVDGTTSDFVCKDERNKEIINNYKSIYTVIPESLTILDEKKFWMICLNKMMNKYLLRNYLKHLIKPK